MHKSKLIETVAARTGYSASDVLIILESIVQESKQLPSYTGQHLLDAFLNIDSDQCALDLNYMPQEGEPNFFEASSAHYKALIAEVKARASKNKHAVDKMVEHLVAN